MAKLEKLNGFGGAQGPVVTIVMDGIGIAPATEGNAVANATTPTLDMLMEKYPCVALRAHGTAVGLPSDDDMVTPRLDTTLSEQVRYLLRVQSWYPIPSKAEKCSSAKAGRLWLPTLSITAQPFILSVCSPTVTYTPTSITSRL